VGRDGERGRRSIGWRDWLGGGGRSGRSPRKRRASRPRPTQSHLHGRGSRRGMVYGSCTDRVQMVYIATCKPPAWEGNATSKPSQSRGTLLFLPELQPEAPLWKGAATAACQVRPASTKEFQGVEGRGELAPILTRSRWRSSERRMVEAAGVEPASLVKLPAATTCLVR
jgi:hypothetical protein